MPTVYDLKQAAITETPLFLFETTLRDGSIERWSTHHVVVDGAEFKARVLDHNAFDLKASFDESLDASNKLSLNLANADSHFSQLERHTGFKGARVTVKFVFYDLTVGQKSADAMVVFQGVANPPEQTTESAMRLSFGSRLNYQRILLPEVRIQKRCPWTFPSGPDQRSAAVSGGAAGRFAPFYRCGYSADQTGGVGNLQTGGAPFVACDFSRANCVERGMFDQDSAGHSTKRFGGIEFVPASVLVRGYGEKGTHVSPVIDNLARYNDFVPLVYGTAWYQPPIVFARNDGNLTRMEVLLGMGEMADVVKVIVNDVDIPQSQPGKDMTATGWFTIVTLGTRSGAFNTDFLDSAGHPAGDPYGSMAMLSVVVPNRINDGLSLPTVEVLVRGMKLDRYAADGTFLDQSFTNNPAWALLDVLRRSGWSAAELDLTSFAAAAAYCDAPLTMTDLNGNPAAAPRFQCNLVLRRRRSAADVIRGVRNGAALFLAYGPGGLLQLRIEGTLANQSPSRPSLSNSTSNLAGGWPAYEFSDGSGSFSGILRDSHGAPSIRLWSRSLAETPNRYSVEFQDQFNEYQQDSLSLVDIADTQLTGQELGAALLALGIPNFDQATRIMRLHLDKSIRGNLYVDFETSVRGLGVSPGDIITVTYLKDGLARQPFRVVRVSPGSNYRTVQITAQLHDDTWYSDLVNGGQGSRRQTGIGLGVPRPLIGNVRDANGVPRLDVQETARQSADGTFAVTLSVGFSVPDKPSNSLASIPALDLSPSVSPTGGTLAGGQTLYYAVSGVDANGAESALSFIVPAKIPTGASTHSATLTSLSFSAGTAAFDVYRGSNPSQLLRIAAAQTVAGQFVDTGASSGELKGPPDENYDHANFYWRLELQPEIQGTIATANTIGNSTLQMIANERRGAVVRITKGKGAGQERSVGSNDATSLTVTLLWTVVPDTTSFFVVCEASWKFGALSATSPVSFDVPNRAGATVQLSGRAANVVDVEAPYELSPLRRWVIGGAAGSDLDSDVPPAPVFGLNAPGDGSVELAGISFPSLTNTRTIAAGTLTLWYWNELDSSVKRTLAAAIAVGDTTIQLAAGGAAFVGEVIQVESEVILVTAVLASGTQYQVTRGYAGSFAAAHPVTAVLYELSRQVQILPFARDFFGSPASGSYGFSLPLPDVRVAASELYMTNSRGNSDTSRIAVTANVNQGLRTLSGGQITFQVEGYLAVITDITPPYVVDQAYSIRDIFASLREPATGGPVQLKLRQNGADYCFLTISSGATRSNIVNGLGLPPLVAKAALSLDVTSVPFDQINANNLPGRDLTVTVRL